MKLDVRLLCSRLPTYFSKFYTEYVFSEEMRLIRPLVEVESEGEVEGDVKDVLKVEVYNYIDQLLGDVIDAEKIKETLRKYANWTIDQLDLVGVEK